MSNSSNVIRVLSVGVLTLASTCFAAQAQTEDPFVVNLDEILILYGSKETNTLSDSSSSVAVTTAEDIESYQIYNFRDAFRTHANIMDADWNDAGFIIRGVNSEGLTPGGGPLASVYIDGVEQTVNGVRRGARGLWDVEQMEIYRGPQSTLSGRAALAGAVYIKTKDPVYERQAELSGTYGNNNLIGTSVMFNLPIIDNELAFRFAASFEESENDINYPDYSGFDRYEDFIHDTYYNIRGKLLYEPGIIPGLRSLFSYSFSHDSPTLDDIAGPGLSYDWNDRRGDFNLPAYTEDRSNDVHNVGFENTYDFNDMLRLTSLSGFTHSLVDRSSVNEGTLGETDVTSGDQEGWLATQELRLNYTGDRWDWVGGLYASYEDHKAEFNRVVTAYGREEESRSTRQTANFAIFGEATYEFIPTWYVTAGGRADYTTQDTTEYFERNSSVTEHEGSFEEFNLIPKLGLSKDLAETQTVGVTYSQGFRTGGSGIDRDPVEGGIYTYDPETASTYEFFYKGRFLDERLILNANVFYTEYNDQQVEILTSSSPYATRVVNAASSESYGFEIEPHFDVSENLSVFASVGYVHTEFKEFDGALGDLSGFPFPEAPEWSVAFGGHYRFANGFYVGGDVKYTSSYLSSLGQVVFPLDYIDARVLVNAQAGYKTENWEINFFAENLLDETYFTHIDSDYAGTLGDRRSYGVNVKAKF